MVWILATRGASTKLRLTPFTETVVEEIHSVVYKPGVESIPNSGADANGAPLGTFARGVHRISGFLFTYDGSAAETLLTVESAIDLIVRYRGNGNQKRKRIFQDIIFAGDATVTVPGVNTGIPELVGVPFRVQIPVGDTIADHITDEAEV